jgi:hypothetical protein
MMKLPSRRSAYGLILLLTIPLGLAVRMAPLRLSAFVYKYGGSALWAMALYWFVAVWMPQRSITAVGAAAAAGAAILEFSRLWHTVATDAFRNTLAGRILLGRYFSLKNIAAYWLAIGLAALLDEWIIRWGTPGPPATQRPPE